MTKQRPPNPQPTSGTPYGSYVWPRSKTPALQRIYDRLHELGWRYDQTTCEFWTPEGQPEAHGRLEYGLDHTWARIQLPSVVIDGIPYRPPPLFEIPLVAEGEVTVVPL